MALNCDVRGCSNTVERNPNLIFITLPSDRCGHSKWLNKTFGAIGGSETKCQTVCEHHADPQFVELINKRHMSLGSKTPENEAIRRDSSPGSEEPDTHSQSKTKPAREQPKRKLHSMLKKHPAKTNTKINAYKKQSFTKEEIEPKKKPSTSQKNPDEVDPLEPLETSGSPSPLLHEEPSEIMIKDEPVAFESELLPSVMNLDMDTEHKPMKQELVDHTYSGEIANSDMDVSDNQLIYIPASRTEDAKPTETCDDVVVKDEKLCDPFENALQQI